ncbi:DUF1285 domain-containing protein [Alteromonas sp. D210916BOD_24]|uniref:DUF1285 domain-containing protein n=1 Tax=Alteromonas sp. D210916BOD_24 TaxID=3157618 RepID=UPI00399D55C1
MDLTRFQQQLKGTSSKARPLPPVEQWNPAFCGDINLTIALDGRWFYEGSPIGRASLVALFASVLKREGDNYYLVTPVEKVGITVEDTPFLITQWRQETDNDTGTTCVVFTTQTNDEVRLTDVSQLELRSPPAAIQDPEATPIPYVCVRKNLWARVHQNVYYQLLEQATQETDACQTRFILLSNGKKFVIGQVEQ